MVKQVSQIVNFEAFLPRKYRKALGIQVDATEDGYGDQICFLSSIKGKKDLVTVENSEYDKETTEVCDENDGSDEEAQEHSSSDWTLEEERRRYYGQLSEHLHLKLIVACILLKLQVLFYLSFSDMMKHRGNDWMRLRNCIWVEWKVNQNRGRIQTSLLEGWSTQQDGNEDSMMTHSAQDSGSDKEDYSQPLVVPLGGCNSAQEEIVKKVYAPKTVNDFEIVPAPATDSSDSSSDNR
ncbi:hypothetical protein HAX54_039510 [Datura stramonium]|uniref:Uncharacterized protein n=1 Tax=Datura stramonium TaxID=4076 RepID=A0ABS8VLE7_DATST|nr:hypothetical protein [Datura stramonium]